MPRRYDPNIHHRQSIRLRGYDYTQAGAYFVTICTQGRQCLFGDIVDSDMRLNQSGESVMACWHELPEHFPHVALDAFVVMPNHVHGIVVLNNNIVRRGEALLRPYTLHGTRSGSLGPIIQNFKSYSTRHINVLRGTPGMPV